MLKEFNHIEVFSRMKSQEASLRTVSLEGTFCDIVQLPFGADDMQLIYEINVDFWVTSICCFDHREKPIIMFIDMFSRHLPRLSNYKN